MLDPLLHDRLVHHDDKRHGHRAHQEHERRERIERRHAQLCDAAL